MATQIDAAKAGAAFLITPVTGASFFTPEDFDEELHLIVATVNTFMDREVMPRIEAIEHQEPGLMRELLRKAGEQGLLMADIPEEYGGADMGMIASTIINGTGRDASFGVAIGAHTGIGTLPIVFYGSAEQKRKYLPKLATGEWVAAYALTEPQVGSDAMGIHSRATLAPDGQAYILNGAKQWISNAGFADIFIVFAKIDDTQHTAFIVERDTPGLSLGAEEKKMGIKGSSTRTVYLDNVRVPKENVLGEIGKGYRIAFNILNIGRLKLGAAAAGGSRQALQLAVPYTAERHAFGKPLHAFGMIKKKLALMAAETYAIESLVYRTVGLMEEARRAAGDDPQAALRAIEEYAIESSIAKVYGSEVLSRVVDEGVQIFGGYGFMQEYPIEKAYRDARILRIFEGTNEINRLVAAGTLFRRALKGQIDIFTPFADIDQQMAEGQAPAFATAETPAELRSAVDMVERIKRASLYAVMKAAMKFMTQIEDEQEFLEYAANLLIDIFALDSAVGRALMAARRPDPRAHTHALLAQLAVWKLLPEIRATLEQTLRAAFTGADLHADVQRVRTYLGEYDRDGIATQRDLAGLVVAASGFPLPF
jgi:alkylation response protein AidB-like acyl-CoA dehydrogenase